MSSFEHTSPTVESPRVHPMGPLSYASIGLVCAAHSLRTLTSPGEVAPIMIALALAGLALGIFLLSRMVIRRVSGHRHWGVPNQSVGLSCLIFGINAVVLLAFAVQWVVGDV